MAVVGGLRHDVREIDALAEHVPWEGPPARGSYVENITQRRRHFFEPQKMSTNKKKVGQIDVKLSELKSTDAITILSIVRE